MFISSVVHYGSSWIKSTSCRQFCHLGSFLASPKYNMEDENTEEMLGTHVRGISFHSITPLFMSSGVISCQRRTTVSRLWDTEATGEGETLVLCLRRSPVWDYYCHHFYTNTCL